MIYIYNIDIYTNKLNKTFTLYVYSQEFSDEYHEKKTRDASQADTMSAAFGPISPRLITRSNSIQDELLTTFATH